MNEYTIDKAEELANKFILAVDDMRKRVEEQDLANPYNCKQSAALRRSSMELTRALSEMRNT